MSFRSMLDRAAGCVARGASRYAIWTTLAALLVTLLAGHYAARNLGVNTDAADLLSPELPFRQTITEFKEAFPQFHQTMQLVLSAPTPEQADAASRALGERLGQHPEVIRSVYNPSAMDFFQQNGLLFRDQDELEALTEDLVDAQPLLARLMADATVTGFFDLVAEATEREEEAAIELDLLYRELQRNLQSLDSAPAQRLSWRRLMAGKPLDGPYRNVLVVQPRMDYQKIDPAAQAIAAIKALADELALESRYGARLGITGSVALAHDELQTVMAGAQLAGILALILVAIVLYVGLRSVRLVLAALATLLIGLVLTAGFATLAVGRLNLISVAFAVLYIGLGVDYAIHFILRYREIRAAGAGQRGALGETAREMGRSLGLCTVSTAIAFYAFVPSSFLGVSELGLIAGTAMFISLAVSFTVLPALITLLRVPRHRGLPAASTRFVGAIVAIPERAPRAVLGIAGLLGVVSLLALPLARFDVNPINLRAPDSPSVATLNALLEDDDHSVWNALALAESETEARRISQSLAELDVVAEVTNVFDFVPENQQAKLAAIDELGLLLGPGIVYGVVQRPEHPTEQALAAMGRLREALRAAEVSAAGQALGETLDGLLQRLQGASVPEREGLIGGLRERLLGNLEPAIGQLQTALGAQQVSLASLPDPLKQRWVSPAGIHHIQASPAADVREPAALERFVTRVQSVAPQATGAPVLHYESGKAVVGAFQQSLALAVAGIFAVLIVALRGIRPALTVLMPLLLAGVVTGAATVVLGLPFNFANIIALPLLLGVSVDNGIHIVHRSRLTQSRKQNLLKTSTARAVVFSTLTTVCSFGNLSFSPHPGTASMGQLLSVGILLTLASTLLVLPALLVLGARRRQRQEPGQ